MRQQGLHVFAPIKPTHEFLHVRHAVIAAARELGRRMPDMVTTNWWKEERGNRVFLDFDHTWTRLRWPPAPVMPSGVGAVWITTPGGVERALIPIAPRACDGMGRSTRLPIGDTNDLRRIHGLTSMELDGYECSLDAEFDHLTISETATGVGPSGPLS